LVVEFVALRDLHVACHVVALNSLGVRAASAAVGLGVALSGLGVSASFLEVALYVVPVGLDASLFSHGVLLVD
jgi:hypothetical protein